MAVVGVHGNTDLVSLQRVMREAECARVCMHAYVCVGELYLKEQELRGNSNIPNSWLHSSRLTAHEVKCIVGFQSYSFNFFLSLSLSVPRHLTSLLLRIELVHLKKKKDVG